MNVVYDGFIRKSVRMYYILFITLAVGTFVGSLFYVNRYWFMGDIKQYIDGCISGGSGDFKSIAIDAIKSNILMMLIMTICSLFKPGILIIVLQILRRGFISGFTSCAIFSSYGTSGFYAILSMFPQNILAVPAVILLASVLSASAITKSAEKDKKFYLYYIFFLVLIGTIFCMASFMEGYFSTIFMNKVINTVT